MENEACLFINTDQNPIKIQRMGLFKTVKMGEGRNEFTELCELTYPHPQAPNLIMKFDKDKNFILAEKGNHVQLISKKQVEIIYKNIKKGCSYKDASPLFDLTREQFAWLVNNKEKFFQEK